MKGCNTFINYHANELFNKGEYAKDPLFSQKNIFASRILGIA